MAILSLLLGAGVPIGGMEAMALRSAAAVNNTDMLAFLVRQGADLHADDDAALTAAAATMAVDAVDWLLAQGADVHAQDDAALLAAVGSLDETMVEALLAAGADIHAGDELPLRTALSACPHELYDSETDFIHQRAGMVAVLLRHGASPDSAEVAQALRQAPDARELIQALLNDAELASQEVMAVDRLATAAFGDTDASWR
jgi:ankyrin repeat protein